MRLSAFGKGIDESKTHLILSLFLMNILRLNVQFKCQIMEYSPNFGFCKILEKKKQKSKKKQQVAVKKSNVATSVEECRVIIPKSQHLMTRVATSESNQVLSCNIS